MVLNIREKIKGFLNYRRTKNNEVIKEVKDVEDRYIEIEDLEELFNAHNIPFKYGKNKLNMSFPQQNLRISKSPNEGRYVVSPTNRKGGIITYCSCYYREAFDVVQYYMYLESKLEGECLADALKLQYNLKLDNPTTLDGAFPNKNKGVLPIKYYDDKKVMDFKFSKRLELYLKLSEGKRGNSSHPFVRYCNSWKCLKWDKEGYLLCNGERTRVKPSYFTTIQILHADTHNKFGFTERVMQQLESFDNRFKDYYIIDFLCSHYYDAEFENLRQQGLSLLSD